MERTILMLSVYPSGFKRAWVENGYRIIEDANNIIELDADTLERKILEYRNVKEVNYVFSFNFFSVIAEICHRYQMNYISWIVDSPHASLWSKAAKYDTNLIFDFDYLQGKRLQDFGNTQTYHLPLATDVELFQSVIKADASKSQQKYSCDVAFMANLYDRSPHNLYDQVQYLPPYVSGYLDSLMKAQRQIWGVNLVHSSITDKVWGEIRKNIILDLENEYEEQVYQSFIEGIIHKKIAQLERKEVCSYLARHFDFSLYSGSNTSYDEKINNRGYIDYVKEMPLVFHYSKININITLHSISTGIPLRVLDILACGGFCLTNYQEEIAAYFEDGVELVMYSDFNDMYDKISYYLAHEEERQAIARAGYEKVKSQFDYTHGVQKIVDIIENYCEEGQ